MTPKDSQSRTSSPSNDGVAQAERLSRFQAELFEKVQEVNHRWLERVQLEVTLAAKFATKMTSARSFPDAAAIFQEWASQQLKLAVEDASYAISTGQALMDMGARLLQGDDRGKGWVQPGRPTQRQPRSRLRIAPLVFKMPMGLALEGRGLPALSRMRR